jgi:hypothetical protein
MSQPKPFSPVMPVPNEAVEVKAPRKAPATPNKIVGAKVFLQFLGEDGKILEAVHSVDPSTCEIQSYNMNVECKHQKKKDPDSGDLVGFEDTGERIFSLKLRYHVR